MQSVFFCCAPLGAATFWRGQSKKKKHHPGCFFLLRPRRKAREGEAPLEAGTGPEQKKKNTTQGVFFCCGPGESQGKEKPRWKPARGQSKKKHHPGCFFFLLRPRGKAGEGEAPLGAGTGPEQKVFLFFCSGPVPAPNGASPSPAFPRGRSQKKTPWVVFFFFALAPCWRQTGLLLPLPFPGAGAKKKHPGWCFFLLWPRAASNGASPSLAFRRGRSKKKNTLAGWCFFFAAAPRGRSLTHCGPGWRCLPPRRGGVFFLLRPRPDRGGVFFSLWPRPDAHSLTVGWGDFGKARVFFFFLLRPRRVFLDNSKKCLGYYIGSKKTRRGHSKKKNTTSNSCLPLAGVFFFFAAAPPGPGWCFFCCGPARTLTHSLWAGAISARPGWCFFFAAAPPGLFRQ